jgi:hypothetical protein
VSDRPTETTIQGTARDFAQYEQLVRRFVDLANIMKDEGHAPPTVNAAMMLASGLYASYLAVGNHGQLDARGVDEVSEVYRKNLLSVQQLKKQGMKPGSDTPQ